MSYLKESNTGKLVGLAVLIIFLLAIVYAFVFDYPLVASIGSGLRVSAEGPILAGLHGFANLFTSAIYWIRDQLYNALTGAYKWASSGLKSVGL